MNLLRFQHFLNYKRKICLPHQNCYLTSVLQFYLNVDRWQFCTETRAMISFSRIILLLDN